MIPPSVDCIIIGTGLTNSVLAAAFSRIGKSVLHVDKNAYYGDEWASFTFQQLIDWVKRHKPEDKCLQDIPEELFNKSKMFCIDLCPRLLYSNGPMVDLLVKSNVSRYHEFKNNIRILSMVEDKIHVLPCRRSDVFTSPLLSDLVDKRRLMKFIEMCVKFDPTSESPETCVISQNQDKPIEQFLEERGLKHTLKEFIINSIAMVSPTETTRTACDNIKRFMIATERFGRSPFLFPVYGCGEFPQSFCRLSAVFGGVYCLNADLGTPAISPCNESAEKFSVKINNEYEVKSDILIMDMIGAEALNLANVKNSGERLSRAILITNESIELNDDRMISFMRIPPKEGRNENLVHLMELNASVMVAPPDLNLVYFWTKSSGGDAASDLTPTIDCVFGDKKGTILWALYYHQLCAHRFEDGTESAEGLHLTSPPSPELDYGSSIEEAERIFKALCPSEKFLPRAPDPDEIIS